MNEPTSPTLFPLTSLANTPRLLSPEPRVRVKRVHIKREEPPSEPAPDFFPVPIQRPQLHPSVLTLSHLRRRRLRHNLPRDLVSISKICRDLQERVNDVPVPIIPTVPSFPHLRSAGPVNVYEDAVAAATAATEDAERIQDIKIQLELHAHELEVMRGCVFERFEDLFDAERLKILKMQVDCCFRDLHELQVEINHRVWSGRLRQPLQPLEKVHVSLPTGSEGKRRGRGREGERESGSEQASKQREVPARDVAMGSGLDIDLNLNVGAQFEGIEWPEFTDEQIADMLKEMEEEMLDEPVDWEEILRAEARVEDRPVKREPEDDGMKLDDADETETAKVDHANGEEVDKERMEEDADMKEPEESIWSEESGGVDPRACLSLAHPCDPGAGWSWNPAWGRRQ
ncbi:unnamed protein product [Sordaria macrospora k-hell]|uniref:WGS project CABT00000000 data, contig 2.13 n=2 Tax=Sordaria macrospora TaxID=5147 RepID=F7VYG0_SORMK|nr:uncharacterized protein SMAC_06503 [Sordaria macrospora k-hell]CCC10554.1 unnamed protein product [Sordaria macrospora k-hell]